KFLNKIYSQSLVSRQNDCSKQELKIPVDLNTLPEAERRSRLRRKTLMKTKKEEVKVTTFEDDFQLEYYKKFWNKK
ncbi:hypothetical protein Chor_014601, partial [Crotalus horridus]